MLKNFEKQLKKADRQEKGLDDFSEFSDKKTSDIEKMIQSATASDVDEILQEIAEVKSHVKRESLIGALSKQVNTSKSSLKKDLKKYATKSDAAETDKEEKKIALFPGLVDLVDDNGKVAFLIKDETGLHVKTSIELDGVSYKPPDKEHLPFALPRADRCLSYYQMDDQKLFGDIMAYLRRFSFLTDDMRLIVALYVFQTYLQDHPGIHYQAMLLFHAVPERGKSRTGKAVAYISYRGVHVVDMREANIFRYSGNLGATIFFDMMNLWKKAERNQSEDILLLRYEKGARVARVLYPEKGAFADTAYYSVYGPTIMATNESVHKILGSRCILFSMPNAPGNYENPTPELAVDLKSSLTAWRAKMIDRELPEVPPLKGISGRLWDITMPLFQLCSVVCPEMFEALTAAILNIAGERATDKQDTFDGIIVQVLAAITDGTADHYNIRTSELTDPFNERWQGDKVINEKAIGKRLKALGVQTDRKTGRSVIRITQKELNTLMEQHGLISVCATENNSENSENTKRPVNLGDSSTGLPKEVDSKSQETQAKLKRRKLIIIS